MKSLFKTISNLPGWRTKRKFIILESDDWGSLRAPTKGGFEILQKKGLPLGGRDGIRFNMYDDIASSDDLNNLFEVLSSVKDSKNNPAVFTPLALVTNPDFSKIEDNNFESYFYESFLDTLNRQNKSDAWALWEEGNDKHLFIPEFHGREHLNIQAWLRDLQKGDKVALEGFKYHFWGFRPIKSNISYQAAFGLEFKKDIKQQHDILADGLMLFEKIHGRKAECFVPPNGPLNNKLEKTAAKYGVTYVSTPKLQKEPLGNGKSRNNFRYLGKKNNHNQIYLTRNAFFEPSNPRKSDWVSSCLKEIETAFNFHKPVTISSHRVNYIGSHSEKNRDHSLKELKKLLDQALKKWPDIEFVTSAQLGNLIKSSKK